MLPKFMCELHRRQGCHENLERVRLKHFTGNKSGWSLDETGEMLRLMPPAYVKRLKNDATDAEAICEAITRANMRFCANQDR